MIVNVEVIHSKPQELFEKLLKDVCVKRNRSFYKKIL